MKRHRIVVIGCGSRGMGMARNLTRDPSRAEIVAAAEVRDDRRPRAQQELGLPAERMFSGHEELLDKCNDIDAALIATQPFSHSEIARACMEKGLALFLEKPMADTIEGAKTIADTASRLGTQVHVGFNLRYAPFYEKLHELVTSGALGKIMTINWTEAPSCRMYMNGYCRNPSYNRKSVIGSWLLEKSCHDIDQFNWLVGERCVRVSSFGGRRFFVPRDDVPEHCTDGCPISDECMYFSHKQEARGGLHPEESDLCVYRCGSDLVDRQTTLFEYPDGTVVTFNLIPVDGGRFMHIAGSEATLSGRDATGEISVRSMRTGIETIYRPQAPRSGHGGADQRTTNAFLDYLDDPAKLPMTTVPEGLEAVIMCCGADLALEEHRVVELDTLR